MSYSLNKESEPPLQFKRMTKAMNELQSMNYDVEIIGTSKLMFKHREEWITFFPYSGWASGKNIKDGRGLQSLLKQLNEL